MQWYPDQTPEKLEFSRVCQDIARLCSGRASRERAIGLTPSSDFSEVEHKLNRADEFNTIRCNGLHFPEFHFVEAEKEIAMLRLTGAVLEGRQIILLRELVVMTSDLIRGVRKLNEFPALIDIVSHIEPDERIHIMMDTVLTETGTVRSTASRALAEIRRDIEDTRKRIARIFDGLLRKYRKLGWLREYSESVYHDRRVLAVVAEYKNKIEGIIHGSSESGNTAFVEPSDLVSLNNSLSAQLSKENEEERRILRQLTAQVAEHRDLIQSYFELITVFDLLEAQTKYARMYNGVRPKLNSSHQRLSIKQAVHPVLFLKNKQMKLDTIPLDLELTTDQSILVISGPNAGGKSIALKTVGLLQLMLQSGLLIPVDETSEMPVFAQLLVDIGDDQSIEQQLSTYSSRLRKQKHFLRVADSRSLILLDEFGTGSDPELGGAIAESILIHLLAFRPWGIITTHFGNIKVAAENLNGLRNGSMLFNEITLEPEYKLKLDTPGSSYTFEVARKIGMDKKVLDLAKKKVDGRKIKLDQLLIDIHEKYKQVEFEINAVKVEREMLRNELERIEREREEIRDFKASRQKEEFKRMLALGKKYEELLDFWNARGDKKALLDKIKQGANKKFNKEKKSEVKEGKASTRPKKERRQNHAQSIEVGDRVKLVGGGKSAGTVLEMDGKKVLVAFGNMKLSVKTDQLVLAMKKSVR